MKILVSLLDSYPLKKLILGDFNATSDKIVHAFLEKHKFHHTYSFKQLSHATFHNFQGTLLGDPIDYIYITEDWNLTSSTIDQQTLEPVMLSDHYPVICNVE
jgi:endonuclease/exonuclease/phosphatase family metal-dependent hydrolase